MTCANLQMGDEMEFDPSRIVSRRDWTFPFTSSEVRMACEAKFAYHMSRYEHWSDRVEALEAKLKNEGVEFREYQVTGGKQLDVVLDPQIAKELNEAKDKQRQHERSSKEYRAYLAGLSKPPVDVLLRLTADDIVFFGLDVVDDEDA
jgi:hypothetical protein